MSCYARDFKLKNNLLNDRVRFFRGRRPETWYFCLLWPILMIFFLLCLYIQGWWQVYSSCAMDASREYHLWFVYRQVWRVGFWSAHVGSFLPWPTAVLGLVKRRSYRSRSQWADDVTAQWILPRRCIRGNVILLVKALWQTTHLQRNSGQSLIIIISLWHCCMFSCGSRISTCFHQVTSVNSDSLESTYSIRLQSIQRYTPWTVCMHAISMWDGL